MKDFNIYSESEDKYTDKTVVENELDLFIQEIDVLFSTSKFDVLGDPGFGTNIEDILWKTNISASKIEQELSDAVRNSCFMNEFFEWKIKVNIIRGQLRDIAVIDVKITRSDIENQTVQYIFK